MNHIIAAPAARSRLFACDALFRGRRPLKHNRAAGPFCKHILATSLELGRPLRSGSGLVAEGWVTPNMARGAFAPVPIVPKGSATDC